MTDEPRNDYDAVVVGGGAAGLNGALMLARARRSVVVIDAGAPRNAPADGVHGLLAREGMPPSELVERGRAEVRGYGGHVVTGEVAALTPDEIGDGTGARAGEGFTVVLADGRSLHARRVLVATGLVDELPDVAGVRERWGRDVLHCPYCHGWEVRDRRIGVLTTSPLSMHQAQLIRQWSDDVVVFTAGLGDLSETDEQRLRARGITLVPSPVVEVLGEGDQVTAVRTDGQTTDVGAIFTGGVLRPHDDFLSHLGLDRADTPAGSFLAVDATGKTSSDRIWAVGNVSNPMANVPISMSAGTMAGSFVNATLVGEDFDRAVAEQAEPSDPVAFWQNRYAGDDRIWSGNVNAVLGDIAAGLQPGTALDLGSGEGADVVWLAKQGWRATGIDISANAIARGRDAARAAGLTEEQASFVVSDLSDPSVLDRGYDLVTASFFHSPVELPRTEILRRAAALVNVGGHLLITSHAAAPPWADAAAHEHRFLDAKEELDELDLPEDDWERIVVEHRERAVTSPSGDPATLEDSVVLLRRR